MWIPEALPVQLKKLRDSRGLSQASLSLQTGLAPSRISEFERGVRTPRDGVLEALSRVLGFDPGELKRRTSWEEPAAGRPENRDERHLLTRFSPDLRSPYHPPRRRDFAFHMAGVRDRFARVLRVLEAHLDDCPNNKELGLFLRDLPADSADEALLHLHLVACGSRTGRVSPASLGFFAHAVIDPISRQVVGHRRRPTVGMELAQATFALVPQVAVRPGDTVIMDCLVGIHEGSTSWVDLEVDGGGHDARWDEARTQSLGLPVLRVETEMLHDPHFARRLLRTLLWMHRNSFRGVVRKLSEAGVPV